MRNLISAIILLILFSCNTSKNTVYRQTDSQIYFGNSGGFTNLKLEYVLNEDGNIFKITRDSTFYIKKIDHNRFKDIQCSINECEFRNIQLNSPGNMTYFIRVKTNEFDNKVVWSDVTTLGPVENIYNKLFDSLKK